MGKEICKNVDNEKVFVSKKVYSGGKNYKYFVIYLYDDYKIKLSHIMLSKMKVYVNNYEDQIKWIQFLCDDDDLWKNPILFGIKKKRI